MAVRDTLSARRIGVWLLDDDETSVSPCVVASASGASEPVGMYGRYPLAAFGAVRDLLATEGSMVVVPDAAAHPGIPASLVEELSVESVFAASLYSSHQPVGFITVEPAGVADVEQLGPLLPLIASSAALARAAETAENRRALGELLLDLSELDLHSGSLEEQLRAVTGLVAHRISARGVMVMLTDGVSLAPVTAELCRPFAARESWSGVFAAGVPMPLAEAAFHSGVPVMSHGSDPDLVGPEWTAALRSGALTAVPVVASSGPLGAMVVDLGRRTALSRTELRLLMATASQTGRIVADWRARGRAKVRSRLTDAVTELLQAGPNLSSPADAVRVVGNVMRQAVQAELGMGILISPGERVETISASGTALDRMAEAHKALLGQPATDLALWRRLSNSPSPATVLGSTGEPGGAGRWSTPGASGARQGCRTGDRAPSGAQSRAPDRAPSGAPAAVDDQDDPVLAGMGAWLAIGLRVREQLRAVVICGQAEAGRKWEPVEREVLGQLALEGSLVLAHAELREAEVRRFDEMAHRALHDPLTGLANRALFGDRLDHALAKIDRRLGRVAVLFVDLDHFKSVNDQLGHHVGDALLVETARRLVSCLRPEDTVSRLAGDEFTVLLDGISAPEDAIQAADRIVALLRLPYEVCGHSVTITGSIGVAVSEERSGPADILRQADIAMYRAKEAGRDRRALYQANLETAERDRLSQEDELAAAITTGQLELWLQPVVPIEGGLPRLWEALVRWNSPSRGLVEASQFTALAEQSSLIRRIDWWMLERSVELLQRCRRRGRSEQLRLPEQLRISVNISQRLLLVSDIADRIGALLESAEVPAESLLVDVAEDTLAQAGAIAWDALGALGAIGVEACLDRLGAGGTSLSMLVEHPFSLLKIDRRLVRQVVPEGQSQTMVLRLAAALGTALECPVCAVGVETEMQRESLASLGVELGQGRLFGGPWPHREVEALLATRTSACLPTTPPGRR
ncbi:MAG: diguanylate cyclase [Actinomycetota bacterium]|nr:diguanylate cyclase [Actinomycetota bacterium]